jgi:hypothetical protein
MLDWLHRQCSVLPQYDLRCRWAVKQPITNIYRGWMHMSYEQKVVKIEHIRNILSSLYVELLKNNANGIVFCYWAKDEAKSG